ncbi:uncharacterized protein E0L32_003076 [Thyridium curvatum]|uniref:Uncharacterized protein n=1 Tax=Thyridium curvatum TaxID=1093900 RepID=A0A507BD14_9PEZI|nr:uncharacterized protein E0L32_003076 [Thyridium curvatum]TPX17433.1 hypothetical protein E0L32_003076 [Thyridium curvatum]
MSDNAKPDSQPRGSDSPIPLGLWYITGGTGPRPTWEVYLSRAQARVERARDEEAYKTARQEAAKEAKLPALEFKRRWGGGQLDRLLHPKQERERFRKWRQEQGGRGHAADTPAGQEEQKEEVKTGETKQVEEEKQEEQAQGQATTPQETTDSPGPVDNDEIPGQNIETPGQNIETPGQNIKTSASDTVIRDEANNAPIQPVSAAGDETQANSPQHRAESSSSHDSGASKGPEEKGELDAQNITSDRSDQDSRKDIHDGKGP